MLLQHPPVLAILQQAQSAGAVVRLAEVPGDRLVATADRCRHGAQHRPQERLELAIRRIQLRYVDRLAGCQVLEHAWLEVGHPVGVVDVITDQLALGAADEAHQRGRRTGPHDLRLLVAGQVVQPLDRRRKPRHATRLPGPVDDRQMDHLLGGNVQERVADRSSQITRVPSPEPVGDRPPPAVHPDTHAPFVAIPIRPLGLALIDQIGFQDLQAQGDRAAAKRLRHQADEHITRLRHRLNRQAGDLLECQPAGAVAIVVPRPAAPQLLDGLAAALIRHAARTRHTGLQANALPNHVLPDRPQRLPGIGVVAAQLP